MLLFRLLSPLFHVANMALFGFYLHLNDLFVLGNVFFKKMDINKAKLKEKRKKIGRQVRGPGLYKKNLLVQKQPNIGQASRSKSVLFNFFVVICYCLEHVTSMAKCDQMKPSAKVFC